MNDKKRLTTSHKRMSVRDWWPSQLNLNILHQHSSLSNPMGKKFNYDYYDESDFGGGMTFGAGAKLPISGYSLMVDYAYQDLGWLDSVNRFTIGFRF